MTLTQIPDYPGYYCNKEGDIFSYRRTNPVKMRYCLDRKGYYYVQLCNESGAKKKKFIIDNELYTKELTEYIGKNISSIDVIFEDGSTSNYYNDEILNVDKNGHLHYSSFEGGIFDWNEKTQSYQSSYWGSSKEKKVIGFMNIEVDTTWD